MTADEDEAEEVVTELVVHRGVEIGDPRLLPVLEVVPELLELALQPLVPADEIDRAMLRRGHEPGAGVIGDARLRPFLERDDQRVLGELFGEPDVPHDPHQPGDEPGGLDSEHRVDRAMGLGSRHGYQSIAGPPAVQAAPR